jgi:nicotinamidase-related amidase
MSTTLESMFNAADITTPGYYVPSETALLLLDFHTMFVKQAGGDKAPAALEVAAQLRTWAKGQGIQVIHALIDVNMTPFPTCKGSKGFASIAAAMQSTGTDVEPPELLSESSKGDDNDVTFTRRAGYVSALKSPGMEEFLQKRGIKSLVLTGLSTSGCVARTVFAAADAEYVVTVISDGCADRDEDVHEMMVQRLLNNRAYVATAADFQKGFTEASSVKKSGFGNRKITPCGLSETG